MTIHIPHDAWARQLEFDRQVSPHASAQDALTTKSLLQERNDSMTPQDPGVGEGETRSTQVEH